MHPQAEKGETTKSSSKEGRMGEERREDEGEEAEKKRREGGSGERHKITKTEKCIHSTFHRQYGD